MKVQMAVKPKSVCQILPNVKIFLTVFFDYPGVEHFKFWPHNRRDNKALYIEPFGADCKNLLAPHCLCLAEKNVIPIPQPPSSSSLAGGTDAKIEYSVTSSVIEIIAGAFLENIMIATLQQEDCFANIPQDFLICTTIHKARQLGVFQNEIFVRVLFDRRTRQTKTFANSENPYFNEYFVYEIRCTLRELMRLSIVYKVKKRATFKRVLTIGELMVDMQSVWNQNNRCYFKKWGRLEESFEPSHATKTGDKGKAKGFLQIDLAIVSQGRHPNTFIKPDESDLMSLNVWQMHHDYDNIERNLLESANYDIQCNIQYTMTFYRAIMATKSNYMLQFRFHPYRDATHIAKSTQFPKWNQSMTFAWVFPSLTQTFSIQLMAHQSCQWKSIALHEFRLEEIVLKDTPTLGPCYIHFYEGPNESKYLGRLLIELQTECLESTPQRQIIKKEIQNLDEKRYWDEENFVIQFAAIQGDFLHANVSNCKIHMKIGEYTSNKVECFLKPYPQKKGQTIVNHLKYFCNEPPYKAISLNAQLPDDRRKYEIDLFIKGILNLMRQELEVFQKFLILYSNNHHIQYKVLKGILNLIGNHIKLGLKDGKFDYKGLKEPTKCDVKCDEKAKEIFVNFNNELKNIRAQLKCTNDVVAMDREIEQILRDLFDFIKQFEIYLARKKNFQNWPDLLLCISSGVKQLGVCRIGVKDLFYLASASQHGLNIEQCWKMRSYVFKDAHCRHTCNNCGCIMGSVMGCLSIYMKKEQSEFLSSVQTQWKNPEPLYWTPASESVTFKCCIYIHQAKVKPGADKNGLCDPYIRVMFCTNANETRVLFATLSPIWNCVVTFGQIKLPGTCEWYQQNPPLVFLELYDTDKFTADDYLGCGMAKVFVVSKDMMDKKVRNTHTWFRSKQAWETFEDLKLISPPLLKWISIAYKGSIRAEVLMSAELLELAEVDSTAILEASKVTVGIPTSIRPNMRRYVVEVIFAGLRKYKKISLFPARHKIKLMMADLILTSGISSSRIRNSINFLLHFSSGVVSLPEQLEYWPAIIATDVIVSSKNEETTLGAVLISNSKRYLQKNKKLPCIKIDEEQESDNDETLYMPLINDSETLPLVQQESKLSFWQRLTQTRIKKPPVKTVDCVDLSDAIDESEYNWWTKFYNSGLVEPCGSLSHFKHKLCIYSNELEKQPEFSSFTDWAEPLPVVHGVRHKSADVAYATLKMSIKILPCTCEKQKLPTNSKKTPTAAALNPRYLRHIQSLTDVVKIIVRVYIVQGLQFRPSIEAEKTNCYIRLRLGRKYADNKSQAVPYIKNPVFGKCFELEAMIPREHVLEISVLNLIRSKVESMGSTHIDLEDRWRSKHRANVGIANEYCSFGYNLWRDTHSPMEILDELCEQNYVSKPRIQDKTIEIDGMTLEDDTEIATKENLQQRLCLTALKNLEQLPSFQYKLVPEHVESRSLYRSSLPDVEQGKLQMWLELHDANINLPPAIDLTPQPPKKYELRVIVYNVSDVVLVEKNIFGSAMSDIYVKGWCANPEEAQSTDVHYRSMNGRGAFNWRMIFPLKYSSVEDMLVTKRRGFMEEFQWKIPPLLSLQVWDSDFIAKDNLIGALEIHLSNFAKPFDTAKKCRLGDHESLLYYIMPQKRKKTEEKTKMLNIFRQQKVRGWFPIKGYLPSKGNEIGLVGKIDIELEILREKDAVLYPVGIARNPPNALPEPM